MLKPKSNQIGVLISYAQGLWLVGLKPEEQASIKHSVLNFVESISNEQIN